MQYSLFKTFLIDLLFTTMIVSLSFSIYKYFNFNFKLSPLSKIFMIILTTILYPVISIFITNFSSQVVHLIKIIQISATVLIIAIPSK